MLFKIILFTTIIIIIIKCNTIIENMEYTSNTFSINPSSKIDFSSKIDLQYFKKHILGNKITIYNTDLNTISHLKDQNNHYDHYDHTASQSNKLVYKYAGVPEKSIIFTNDKSKSDNITKFYVENYDLKFNSNIIIPIDKFKVCENIKYTNNDSSKSYELHNCIFEEEDKSDILIINNIDDFERKILFPQ